jgi:putative N6-adenine-specific DNA methylase
MEFDHDSTLRLTCAPGLEPFLAAELEALGYEPVSSRRTGVEINGTLRDAMKLNLHLRTAFSVLYRLDVFRCTSPDALYKRTKTLPWEQIIAPNEDLTVTSRVNHPTIRNTMFANVRVKDAIVDRIQARLDARPNSGPERRGVVVELYWRDEQAMLYLNTSGGKLSDRNYRKMPHTAPMHEALAAGVIMATGYDGTQPLIAPMCGSGTLAIEGAYIGLGRAPGLLRKDFSIAHVSGFDADAWKTMRVEARKQGRKALDAPIIASDIDPKAIEATRQNARTAGVEHLIEFHVCDFAETPMPDMRGGIVVLNPQYGRRLSEETALAETYSRIGDFLKQRCAGSTGYVFTGNLELAKKVGLRAGRRIVFHNAGIECRLLKYELYAGTRRHA